MVDNSEHIFPGQERLAQDMGSGRRSVVRYVAELEKAGLLAVKRRGQGRPNLYTVHLKTAFWKKRAA
jgi:Mn-dependent DtxR family transcriptional regulator